MTSDHDRMEELVAACALGACDEEERRAVAAHLPGCPSCRALAERFARTVDAIPLGVDDVRPPARLRARILEAAAAQRPAAEEPEPARILTLPRRPPPAAPRRRLPLPWALVATLTVALVGLAAWNVALGRMLAAPPAHYPVVGTGTMASASGTVVEYRQDAALVSLMGMPQPPDGKVYQLWLIDDAGKTLSAGVFTPARDGSARVGIDHSLANVRTVAVTQEVGPRGAQAPTQKPELAGQIGA
jgi:anti-sigma-K factor RskA